MLVLFINQYKLQFYFHNKLIYKINLVFMFSSEQQSNQNKSTRFLSQNQQIFQTIQIQEEESNEDKIQKQLSQRYSIEQRMYLIINKQTGEVYDSKNQKIIDNLFKHTQFKIPQNSWTKYKKNLNLKHQKMIQACQSGDKNVLASIFNKEQPQIPIDINFKSFDDWAPIHFATFNGKIQCLQFLIKRKANINQPTKFGWTPLHIAAKKNQIAAAILLLQNGCECNIQDEQFNIPLHYASSYGYLQMVTLLLSYGSDQRIKNCQGRTPKDASQNITIFNTFKNEQRQSTYSKQVFGGVLLQNSRTDHIERFLKLKVKNQTLQQQRKEKAKNAKFVNIIKMYQALQAKKNETVSMKDFTFHKLLGKGSFGEVYLVKKIQDEKLYAMKILKKEKVIGTNLFRYIQTEKDVLSLIMHPFVVRLFYSFQSEGKLFLVMQFCEGGDLASVLEKKKKFTQQVARIYICQIILALEALHKNMIIYRDLKPENLVIDKDGHVMLTDFGLSKKGQIDKMTTSFCGTPAYLAPQILQKKGHNRMADWYELGVVLYEFLVGTPPFYAPTREQLYKNKRQNLLKIPKSLSNDCKDLIKKLLHKDPNKRLGIQKDGQSIREHPWFKQIDWQKVYNRQYVPPKPETKFVLGAPLTIKIPNQTLKGQKKQMPEWTFIA